MLHTLLWPILGAWKKLDIYLANSATLWYKSGSEPLA